MGGSGTEGQSFVTPGLRRECRQCGYPLAYLANDRRHIDITPGVYLIVNLPEHRIDVVCPRCNLRRSFTDVVLSAMAVPPNPAGMV